MAQFIQLTSRNIKLFLRDKSAVFFSLLAMFIVLGLMLFFLGDTFVDGIADSLAEIPGRDGSDDKKNAEILVLAWTAAGIVPINAAMVALSTLSSLIRDRTAGRINSIYTAPISRLNITLSYVTAAFITSLLFGVLTIGLSELYLVSKGMEAYSAKQHMILLGMTAVNAFSYSAFMYLLASLVNSEGAWSAIGTITGTLIGFVGGIYLPIGQLSDGLQKVLTCLPVIYGSTMFRLVMAEEIFGDTFDGAPEKMSSEYKETLGIGLSAFGHDMSMGECVAVVFGFGILFVMLGAAATAFVKRKDR